MFRSVKNKITFAFLVALIAVVAVSIYGQFWYSHEHEHKVTDMMGHAAAETCAYLVSIANLGDETFVPGGAEFERCRTAMRQLCRDSDMDYLYVIMFDNDLQSGAYLISAAADDASDEMIARDHGYGVTVSKSLNELVGHELVGEGKYKATEVHNDFGHMLEWFSYADEDNPTILSAAGYSVYKQRNRVLQEAVYAIIPSVVGFIVLLVVQLIVLRKNVFHPLREISSRMRSFATDRTHDPEPIAIRTNDEMGEIAEAYEGMAAEIGDYIAHIEEMTQERVQSAVELDVARRIQLGMVPEYAHHDNGEFSVRAHARAARAVGGDFYDCILLEDKRIALVIGDVSGKGVAAALFMAMAKAMIHDGIVLDTNPASLLNKVNEKLCASNPEGMFVTVFAAVIDPNTGHVHYANAGHTPPLIIGERVRELQMDEGILLGLFEDADIVAGEMVLGQGESLLLYTDGATEAVNIENSFLGEQRFASLLEEAAPYATAQELMDEAVRAVDDFAKGQEQFDDVTFVVCRHNDNLLQELVVDIASFSKIREAILRCHHSGEEKRKMCLACEELFANIVMYSGAEHAWFGVIDDDGGLRVILEDDGAPFDPTTAHLAEKEFDDLDAGGMGIDLSRQLVSKMEYRR
ncbi:MAG: SpoIIE family protein phosphatase, partial [Coriobacteriales bacterium]|nr:SpoIIE family protein phosphatase [Coriobacteriales bacterium]